MPSRFNDGELWQAALRRVGREAPRQEELAAICCDDRGVEIRGRVDIVQSRDATSVPLREREP